MSPESAWQGPRETAVLESPRALLIKSPSLCVGIYAHAFSGVGHSFSPHPNKFGCLENRHKAAWDPRKPARDFKKSPDLPALKVKIDEGASS